MNGFGRFVAGLGYRRGANTDGRWKPETRSPKPETRSAQAGFVLVCVLWVLAILTVIAVGFGRRAMLDRRATAFSFDHSKLMYEARGAAARGVVELRNKAVIDGVRRQGGYTAPDQRWARPLDLFAENLFDRDEAGNAGGGLIGQGQEAVADTAEYKIRDEERLININTAPEELLREIKGLNMTVIRKIMVRRAGEPASGTQPQPFQSIEELRAFSEIKDSDWFGKKDQAGLKDLLTCWGDGRININTAPKTVLKCIPDLGNPAIDAIIKYRAGEDGKLFTGDDQYFRSLGEVPLRAQVGGESMTPLEQYCKVDSQCFTIQGVATRRQGKVRATCTATVAIQGADASVIKWREESLGS